MEKTEMVAVQMPIVGSRRAVERALVTQASLGQLVTRPRDVRIINRPDGLAESRVTLRVSRPIPWRRRHPTLTPILAALAWATGVILAIAAVVGGIGYWVARSIDGPALLGAVALIGGLFVVVAVNRANHSGACAGLHCGGCKGH